jgi:hypothetical protein
MSIKAQQFAIMAAAVTGINPVAITIRASRAPIRRAIVSIQPFRQHEFEISPAGTAADRLNYLFSLNAKANPRKRLDIPSR